MAKSCRELTPAFVGHVVRRLELPGCGTARRQPVRFRERGGLLDGFEVGREVPSSSSLRSQHDLQMRLLCEKPSTRSLRSQHDLQMRARCEKPSSRSLCSQHDLRRLMRQVSIYATSSKRPAWSSVRCCRGHAGDPLAGGCCAGQAAQAGPGHAARARGKPGVQIRCGLR